MEETDISNETLHCNYTKDNIQTGQCKKRKLSFDSEIISYNDCEKIKDDTQNVPDVAATETVPSLNCIPPVSKLESDNCGQTEPNISEIQNVPSELFTTPSAQDSENAVLQSVIKSGEEIPGIAETSNSTCDETNNPSVQECSNNNSIAPAILSTDSLDGSTYLEAKRRTRNSKTTPTKVYCPVCGITVRQPELESHYAQEVERLAKIPKSISKQRRDDNGISTTYVRVKSNRENRLTAKVEKYAAKAKQEVQCPICKIRMTGSVEEINKHVVLCVQNEEDNDEHVVVDDEEEDDESFAEYEIGNETRIRAVSLIPGGYRGLQLHAAKCTTTEDEDLDVDVDDTIAYGQPQYTELDVIPNNYGGIDEARDELRKAVLNDPTVQPKVLESRKWSESTDGEASNPVESNPVESAPADHIVSSLKEKIKDLEDQNNSVKCLICMESYTKPVVSTTCWHVHCEECWLMTMGVKKLCPQCNMIVFPSDLRKIYL